LLSRFISGKPTFVTINKMIWEILQMTCTYIFSCNYICMWTLYRWRILVPGIKLSISSKILDYTVTRCTTRQTLSVCCLFIGDRMNHCYIINTPSSQFKCVLLLLNLNEYTFFVIYLFVFFLFYLHCATFRKWNWLIGLFVYSK